MSVNFIRRHKPALLNVLSTEATYILQHVDAMCLIDRQSYINIMDIPKARDKMIKLLDKLILDKNCDGFLQLLHEEEIQELLPGLKAIMKNQELSRRDSRDGQLPDCTQPGASGSVVNGQDHLSTGRPRERAVEVSGPVIRPVEGAGVDGHSDCQASTGSGGLLEKRQHLNLENCSFARIEELVSNPEKAETLMSELQNKLKDGEMDRIERKLRSKKCIKENWCYTTITNIKNNQGLKEFLEPGEQKIFPSIVFDLFENNRGKKETKNEELNAPDVSLEDTETRVEIQPKERVNDDLEHTHQASENNLQFPAKDSYLNSNAQDSENSYLKEEFLINSGHQSYQTKSEPCMRMQTIEANGEKDEFKPAEKDPLSDSGHESIFDTMNNSYGTLSTKMSSLEGKEGKRVEVSSALKRDRLSAEHQYSADEIPPKVAKHIDATDCDHEAKNSTETNVDKCPCIVEYSLINHANSIIHVTQNSYLANTDVMSNQQSENISRTSESGSTVSTVNKKSVFKNEKDKQKAKRPHKRKDPNLEKEWKKERLVKWLDTYKGEGDTLEDLKNRISWHTKLEHKTFPYIVADQCTIFHVPKTTDRKLIFLTNVDVYKKGGELRKPCYEKLQYQMGVSGISETIVLSPENKTKTVRYDFSFENIAELCRRLVFEVLAPAIVVFKKVQRERELFSDD
ncbi:uncharacterized protein LOC121696908 isoform X7 [Alosa sapidissima]|uniref:uncharacterized protein LOC121696908 isoform X7 n=1 Tax=Alosa sapidissima TaxID=34773 RepID=UPI001C092D73|nr:uncharacterized protein LOC121696908 isoform X7 [Alosa sapidissima]